MNEDVFKKLSDKYCPRFGKIAVDMGLITADQMKEALVEQADDDLSEKPHRLLGRVLLDKGWLTHKQIDSIMNKVFSNERKSEESS